MMRGVRMMRGARVGLSTMHIATGLFAFDGCVWGAVFRVLRCVQVRAMGVLLPLLP